MVRSADSILCATDLSPVGNAAVAIAYRLARPGSVVHLFHVAQPAVVMSPLDGTILTYRSTRDELLSADRRARARLLALVPEGALDGEVRTEVEVVHESDAAIRILEEAARVRAGVVVLGTHGRSGLGRILMGSVAAEVLRKSPVPVVLVGERADREEGRRG
jgi:nucleotide-binding universal stress UspA family protein